MNELRRDSEKIRLFLRGIMKTKVGCDGKMHVSVAILRSTELQILNG